MSLFSKCTNPQIRYPHILGSGGMPIPGLVCLYLYNYQPHENWWNWRMSTLAFSEKRGGRKKTGRGNWRNNQGECWLILRCFESRKKNQDVTLPLFVVWVFACICHIGAGTSEPSSSNFTNVTYSPIKFEIPSKQPGKDTQIRWPWEFGYWKAIGPTMRRYRLDQGLFLEATNQQLYRLNTPFKYMSPMEGRSPTPTWWPQSCLTAFFPRLDDYLFNPSSSIQCLSLLHFVISCETSCTLLKPAVSFLLFFDNDHYSDIACLLCIRATLVWLQLAFEYRIRYPCNKCDLAIELRLQLSLAAC